MDYKETLNLPVTRFPMKANLPHREPQQLEHWKTIDLYKVVRESRKNCKRYILHDGPPYANGQIHLGHSVNKVLKDIVVKSHILSGYDAPYIPGWDCHGLPIEVNVEKKYGRAGVKISHEEFRKKCREYAAKQIEEQKKDFLRLGILGDWQNPYMTMNYKTEADTIRSLGKIIDKGYLRRGNKPVHWCLDCKSALAEAEVEYHTKTSDAIDVIFSFSEQDKVRELINISSSMEIALAIWTTTPWTIPANRGLCFHPDYSYQLVKTTISGQTIGIIISEELSEACRIRWNKGDDWQVITSGISGKAFEKMKAKHPLYERESLCILGDFVTLDAGTGIVHSAPAYGQDDFVVASDYNLEIDNPVQDNGVYRESLELFGGMHIYKANPIIIEQLEAHKRLLFAEKFEHSYPHCWRHKTPTIQRATPQWFIGMQQKNLSDNVLAAIDKVQWVPGWGKERMRSMIVNRPDWCISRQRSWGTPITLLLHKETGDMHPDSHKLIESIAQRVEQEGIEGWFAMAVDELLPANEAINYTKSTDTVDVWFDSGTTHHTVLQQRQELGYPADIYLEGSDQHRGWFQSSLITSVAINGVAPYKTVLTHGFTVDTKGHKMSKSLGNIIAPQKVIDKLGADILRLWISSTDFSGEMTLSNDILQQSSDIYRRIRNTMRFLLANTSDFIPDENAEEIQSLVEIDRWAINQCRQVQQTIIEDYQNFRYSKVVQSIYDFCAADMGSFYLDIVKDRLYTAKKDGQARRSSQTALWHIREALVRWIAPILSFSAEEIWHSIPEQKSPTIFAEQWHQLPTNVNEQMSISDWQRLQYIKNTVNKQVEQFRKENAIGSTLDLAIHLQLDTKSFAIIKKIETELHFLFICSHATIERIDKAGEETDSIHVQTLLKKSEHDKCVRCWQRCQEIGTIAGHTEICQRCYDNLNQGEKRLFI